MQLAHDTHASRSERVSRRPPTPVRVPRDVFLNIVRRHLSRIAFLYEVRLPRDQPARNPVTSRAVNTLRFL